MWDINFEHDVIININDLKTFTTLAEFTDKYGPIDKNEMFSNLSVVYPAYTDSDPTLYNSQYWTNIQLLGFKPIHFSDPIYFGKATTCVKRIMSSKVFMSGVNSGYWIVTYAEAPTWIIDRRNYYFRLIGDSDRVDS
jgi:hypothetical protein